MFNTLQSNLAGEGSLIPEESTALTSKVCIVPGTSPPITTRFEQENTLFDANALTSAEDAESGEGKGLSRLHSNPAIAALSVPAKVNIILEERLDVVVLDC